METSSRDHSTKLTIGPKKKNRLSAVSMSEFVSLRLFSDFPRSAYQINEFNLYSQYKAANKKSGVTRSRRWRQSLLTVRTTRQALRSRGFLVNTNLRVMGIVSHSQLQLYVGNSGNTFDVFPTYL